MILTMAKYHKWAYEKLYSIVDSLNAELYYADKGLFFKSIHGTLNHLYLVDQLWLKRFKYEEVRIIQLNDELIHDRLQLKKELLQQANAWIEFIANIPGKEMDSLNYKNLKGELKQVPYLKTLMHVFNHGTHHRGQISTVLSQLGKDTPEMDLLYFTE